MTRYSPRKIARLLILLSLSFTLISVIVNVITYWPGNPYTYPYGPVFPMHNRFEAWFSLDFDRTLPAWYTSFLFMAGAILLFATAWHVRIKMIGYAVCWWTLSAGCLLVAINKITKWHLIFFDFMHMINNYWIAWGILGAGLMLLYGRFMLSLPVKTRWGFVLSVILFIATFGMDRVGEAFAGTFSDYHMAAALLGDIEGTLEMLSAVMVIYGVMGMEISED